MVEVHVMHRVELIADHTGRLDMEILSLVCPNVGGLIDDGLLDLSIKHDTLR